MSRLVRGELLKLWTTRLWWGLAIGALAYSGLLTAFLAFSAGAQAGDEALPGLDSPEMIRTIYAQGVSGGYVFALLLGVLGICGEFRHQTITATFLVTPRRSRVITAKLGAYALIGALLGVATLGLAVVVGATIIAARGYSPHLTSAGVPRTVLLSLLAMAVWAVVGVGLGTLLKNQIAAIVTALAVTLVAEPIISLALNALDLSSVSKFLPGNASSALVEGITVNTAGTSPQLLSWWAGALVLVGYGLLAAGAGAALTMRRDIT